MVSDKYWENNRAIESTSMEYFGEFNVCVEDVHRKVFMFVDCICYIQCSGLDLSKYGTPMTGA